MSVAPLARWERYLTAEDHRYLMQFIQNVKLDIPNHKMILLCGTGSNGKTTLLNEIMDYLGDICAEFPVSDTANVMYEDNIRKLYIHYDISRDSSRKKNITAIINLIKYKQSIIAATNYVDGLNTKLLEHSIIINMEHVF
jgi:tRNA uridine 5-carbamoylmethylation protein Kti12